MAKEDRFYAFIIAHTSRSRARVQRIRVEKKSVTIFCAVLVYWRRTVLWLYGLTQQAHTCVPNLKISVCARKTNASARNWKN
jgi:hypothetical protein